MSLPIIQTIQNNINNLKIVKNDIKNAVNTDYNFITNEQIESYPDLIKQSIAYYKNRIPHAIKEGTNLNFNAAPLKFDNMTIKGNTYQKQLSGKNKFGVSERSEVVADVDCLFKDSEILINGAQITGRSSKLTFKDILPAGTYHIKPKVISGTCVNGSGGHALSIVITDTNNTKLVNKWLDGLDMDFTLSEANQLKFSIWIPAGAQFNNYKVGIQIEEGSTATDYEPYCGGQPSPNPDYPQKIKVVTGDNVVKHVGKNEFYGEDLGLWYNDTSKKFNHLSGFKSLICKVKPNTQYTISKKNVSNRFVLITSEDKPRVSLPYTRLLIVDNNRTNYTFTTLSNENYIFLGVYSGTDTEKIAQAIEEIQLEEGTTPTPYEPYREKEYELSLGTMELCKINDYQDILFKNEVGDENYNAELENGAWYKKKVIDKKFLDGKMYFANSGVTNVFYTPVITNYSRINNKPFCDNFKGFNNVDNASSVTIINSVGFNNTYNYNRLYISFNGTIDELKDFLNEKMPTLYYANDNPTYEKITDPTLISQLEALSKAKGNDGTTIITTNGKGLDPVLNFIAYLKEV